MCRKGSGLSHPHPSLSKTEIARILDDLLVKKQWIREVAGGVTLLKAILAASLAASWVTTTLVRRGGGDDAKIGIIN